jgi:NAD(P)H-dependent FMN reductase
MADRRAARHVIWQLLTEADAIPLHQDANCATLHQGGESLTLRVLKPAAVQLAVADFSAPRAVYDAPNTKLKRLTLTTCIAAAASGAFRVLAEPSTAKLTESLVPRPLAVWRRCHPAVFAGSLMIKNNSGCGTGGVPRLARARTGLCWKTMTKIPTATTPSPVEAAPDRTEVLGQGEKRPRLLLLNASLAGPEGNSAHLLECLAEHLAMGVELEWANLAGAGAKTFTELEAALHLADGLVIATGTHWDSWSSPLQRFLEEATPTEASALWLGKPVAVLVTEHSVGGKGVLSRLQGVLVTLGGIIPPLSGVVISRAAELARAAGEATGEGGSAVDFWSPADLSVVAHNLLLASRLATSGRKQWQTWPVDRADYRQRWLGL